jgi:hypothetical protein
VTVAVTFTPTGGTARTSKVTVTIRGFAKPKHKHKGHKH